MIKKIVLSAILVCLFVAIPLSLMGIQRVELGVPFMAFLRNTSRELEQYKIAIPDIPKVPQLEQVGGFWEVLKVLISFLNGFVTFLNFFVTIINVVISLVQYIFLIVKNLITFKDELVAQGASS